MLMPMADLLELGVTPGPTLHIGAHVGEEAQVYAAYGFAPVWWIEANQDVIPELRRSLWGMEEQHVIQELVSDTVREVTFHIASNGQSSSYMELGTHATEHPDVTYVSERALTTTTVDALWKQGRIGQASYMSMDVQGTELDVLRGSEEYLKGVQACYLEVNENEVYVGNALFGEVTDWLFARGFAHRKTLMTPHGWGDALYCR